LASLFVKFCCALCVLAQGYCAVVYSVLEEYKAGEAEKAATVSSGLFPIKEGTIEPKEVEKVQRYRAPQINILLLW
jgi:hypothetical protein